jgi:hypothetical protein
MNKLMIALIASAFAATAAAQGTMEKLESPKAKAKQAEVDAATKAGTDATATKAAEQKGVQDAKAAKGTPKALPTTKDKQQAVQTETKAKANP